jgi:hypothetical protein
MNIGVVVVTVVLVVIVLIATGLLLRSLVASPREGYRRNLGTIRKIRKGIRAEDPDAKIRVDPDDWAGTSPHL